MPVLGGTSTGTGTTGLPSYAASLGLKGVYRPDCSIYNMHASNTRRVRAGLAKASGALTHWAVIGDSTTADALGSSTYDVFSMWHRIVRTRLTTALGVPVGGTGFATTAETSPGYVSDPRWTFTNTWTNGSNYVTGAGTDHTATFSTATVGGETGRYVILHLLSTSGPVTLTVDGTTPATVTLSVSGGTAASYSAGVITFGGTTKEITTVTIDTAANTTHTATLTPTGAANVYPIAGKVEHTAGLVVHNLGQSGSLVTGSGGWGDNSTTFNPPGVRTRCVPATTDALFIMLGVNDLNTAVAPSTVAAALTTVRGYLPNADCYLIGQYQPSGTTQANWQAYIATLYQLADTLDCTLFDLTDRSGGYTIAASNSLMGDNNHPNAVAQYDIATMVTQAMLR